ncbi:MAG: hypothetical protein ACLUD0_19250 [Eubacterium ramulus]
MKKKILSILLAATFTVSMLAGCGSSTATAHLKEQLTKHLQKQSRQQPTVVMEFNITVNLASEPHDNGSGTELLP